MLISFYIEFRSARYGRTLAVRIDYSIRFNRITKLVVETCRGKSLRSNLINCAETRHASSLRNRPRQVLPLIRGGAPIYRGGGVLKNMGLKPKILFCDFYPTINGGVTIRPLRGRNTLFEIFKFPSFIRRGGREADGVVKKRILLEYP